MAERIVVSLMAPSMGMPLTPIGACAPRALHISPLSPTFCLLMDSRIEGIPVASGIARASRISTWAPSQTDSEQDSKPTPPPPQPIGYGAHPMAAGSCTKSRDRAAHRPSADFNAASGFITFSCHLCRSSPTFVFEPAYVVCPLLSVLLYVPGLWIT